MTGYAMADTGSLPEPDFDDWQSALVVLRSNQPRLAQRLQGPPFTSLTHAPLFQPRSAQSDVPAEVPLVEQE